MKILTIGFEEDFTLRINNEAVSFVMFKTLEPGNIKFGINAPRSIKINREEIHRMKAQEQND